MLVVVVASQKGGSGKTTLCGHLAVEAERMNAGPVALIDTDPQGSLSQWWNARAAKAPLFAKVGAFDLESALKQLKRIGVKLAFIDTPPAISESISHVIAHADLIVVPTRPSPHDLRAVGATVDMVERYAKPLIFVINGATQRARITGESAVALSQHGVVAPVTVHHRVDFAASMVDGRTVGEVLPKSGSAKEVGELWLYVQDRLARLAKDPALKPETHPHHFSLTPLSDFVDLPDGDEQDELVVGEEVPVRADEISGTAPANTTAGPPTPAAADANVLRLDAKRDGDGSERRSGSDRRDTFKGAFFSGAERRGGPFGRRSGDH